MEDYINEILAKIKNLDKEEFEDFVIEAKKHGILVSKGGTVHTATDPLPPDPTHGGGH